MAVPVPSGSDRQVLVEPCAADDDALVAEQGRDGRPDGMLVGRHDAAAVAGRQNVFFARLGRVLARDAAGN